MAIQNRRGAYANFDPTKLKPGEFAIVQSGDPNSSNGRAIYICTATGTVLRLVSELELSDYISEAEAILEAVQQQGVNIQTVYTNTATKANEAATSASNAQSSATSASTSATTASNAATSANESATIATSKSAEAVASADLARAVNDELTHVVEIDGYNSNNVLNPEAIGTGEVGGVTIIRNDDEIIFNGTATSSTRKASLRFYLEPGETYTYKRYTDSSKSINVQITLYYRGTTVGTVIIDTNPKTFTVPENVVSVSISIGPNNGVTYENDVYKFSIQKGDTNESYDRFSVTGYTAIDKKARNAMPQFADSNNDGNIVITLG